MTQKPTYEELEERIQELEHSESAWRHAESALRESEERYWSVIDTIHDGIILQAASGEILTWNKGAEEIFGITAAEAVGQTSVSREWPIISEDGSKCEGKDHPSMSTLETGKPHRNVVMGVYRPSGDLRWISVNTNPIYRENEEKPRAVVISFSDITTIKEGKDRSEKSRIMLAEAEKLADLGSWEWDIENDTWTMSDNWLRIHGCTNRQFTTETLFPIAHPDDRSKIKRALEMSVEHGVPYRIEHRIVRQDTGEVRDIKAYGEVRRDGAGKGGTMYGAALDITELRLINEKLIEAQQFAKLGWWEFDLTQNQIEWSPQLYEIFGINPDSGRLRLEQLMDLIRPDFRTYHDRQMKTLLESGSTDFEYPIHRPDGASRWIWGKGKLRRDVDGAPTHMFGIAQDITMRKQVEQEILDNQEKYRRSLIAYGRKWRNILVNIPQIGISLDPEGRVIFANDHFLKLTGWQKQEVLGQNWFDMFIPANIREEVRKVFDATINLKDAAGHSTYENEIVTRTGKLLNVSWSNVLTKNEDGNVLDVTCLGVDMTALRRVEDEVVKQRKIFETMFDTIPDGVVITDTRREILLVNKGMESTFGYKPEELLGKTTEVLYADPEKFRAAGAAVFGKNSEKPGDLYVTYYRHKSGREFPGETFGAKLFDESNLWIGNLGVMRDITEREQAKKHIQQAAKMESIGSLAGGIAHEFNNLLGIIIGNAEMAADDVPGWNPAAGFIREIQSASMRARDVVRKILSISRQAPMSRKPVQISAIIEESLGFLRSTIPATIEIRQHIHCQTETILADPTEISQVMINLGTNAAHAMKGGPGTLEVSLGTVTLDHRSVARNKELPSGSYAMLTVSDTGTGIEPAIMGRIYDPYFTTKEVDEGLGMGLAVVLGIVNKHGGAIDIQSEPGKGTLVEVLFPLIAGRESEETEDTDSRLIGSERILFVDDEPSIVKMSVKMLESFGYHVLGKTGSIEALALFKEAPDQFDLVITDMAMPDMAGDQLAQQLISIRPNIPIILCTGHSDRIDENRSDALGIGAYAMKPLMRKDLAKIVRDVLDGAMQTKRLL